MSRQYIQILRLLTHSDSGRARKRCSAVLLLVGVALGTGVSPSSAQEVYWTDFWQSLKKLGPNATVETVVTDVTTTKGLALDPTDGKLYWASADIEKANLDGTGREVIVLSGISGALGLDIDRVNRKIYWADNQTNQVNRANLNGTGVEVVVSEFSVLDVAVDPVGGKVYWNANAKSIKRANLDGSNIETIFDQSTVGGIEIDLIERKIYWDYRSLTGRLIYRANLDGTTIQPVVSLPFNGNQTALGLDVFNQKIYWGQCGVQTPEGPKCAMERANYDGSQRELVVIQGDGPEAFFDIEVIPSPSDFCELSLSYESGVLSLDFKLASASPATWNLWLSAQSSMVRLWALPIPVIDPTRQINVPIPNFPSVGEVGLVTTLTAPGVGIRCADLETVDTGPAVGAVTLQGLRDIFQARAPH